MGSLFQQAGPVDLMLFAEVLVDVPSAADPYTYAVPGDLARLIEPGVLVRVPFGRRKDVGGLVIRTTAECPPFAAKEIASVLPGKPLPAPLETLIDWVADHYLATRYQVYQAALPKGILQNRQPIVLRLYVEARSDAGRDRLTRRQREVYELLLASREPMLASELEAKAGTSRSLLEGLQRMGAVTLVRRPQRRAPIRQASCEAPPELTPSQQKASEAITGGAAGQVFLLYGVTGSGKTEVYLRAIAHELQAKRGALILVPEISLTPQAIARFAGRFGDRVAVLHSGLSDGERFEQWCRVRSGEADVVIGARSAVFAPVRNLGLIVLDEEHDAAYKQESSPRYHARAVALKRAELEGAKVVLGSATPSLETYHAGRSGRFQLLEMNSRVASLPLPNVIRVDMRHESADGHHGLFSRTLLRELGRNLALGEQTILLLNRRGYAPVVLCYGCGAAAQCPNCCVSLTYHRGQEALVCHYCNLR
ncbi:MAG: primosomal protein N', partial [Cyanobacteria bacterium REEB65]|nr:primosomal protein N' [Cyanobacteria bacterium REEB65]